MLHCVDRKFCDASYSITCYIDPSQIPDLLSYPLPLSAVHAS